MKKVLFLIITCLALHAKIWAWHIVGGEMELTHLQDYTYQLNLIQYFDRAQSTNPGPDFSATVYFFRNSDHTFIRTETLFQASDESVAYTNPECAIGDLQTGRVTYTAEITLDPDIFNEEEGYYVTWERCCRNASISNIVNPSGQGMTYVLEFPPVVKEGAQFINSSPQLFPPLSDYACINQIYYADFSGTDPDGDSIAYSLSTPLNSSVGGTPLPIPQPKPFPEIFFSGGFSIDNVIPGSPSLAISDDGYLTVNPTNIGLYVFSVLVEEFRNGEKLGELRRDFQMLVVDGCDPPTPPVAEVRLEGETDLYTEGTVISYSTADEKCFEYLVVDNAGENVSFKAVGVNFDEEVSDIFKIDSSTIINEEGDTLRVEVCISDCPYKQDEPFIIDLIASDNACPLPQRDTVRMIFNVEPPANNDPFYESPSSAFPIQRTEEEGQVIAIDDLLIGKDDDMDSLRFFFVADGYAPEDYGMSLVPETNTLGERSVTFNWNTSCESYPFGDQNIFDLGIVLEDYDTCALDSGDTLFYELEVILPDNTLPTISVPSNTYNRLIKTNLPFEVSATDADNDPITLTAFGDGFNLQSMGAVFENQSGDGNVSSDFFWDLSCENLNITSSQTYKIFFTSEDEDVCYESNKDTVEVIVNVIVPPNNTPTFEVENNYTLSVNEEFELDIVASDGDNTDLLTLDLLSNNSAPPSEGFSFEPSTGIGRVSSSLSWTPECGLLGDNFESNTYSVDFFVYDDNCPNIESEVHTITFEVTELTVEYGQFAPPNAFTPNGDGRNDTYSLSNLTEQYYNLPPDNCADQFQSIVIFDRAGGTVFKSTDREFNWTGQGAENGTYFFHIDYINTDYKGVITLIR
ncbi:gliding motility-associated C-terminal domain-containing protein [Reichenbachiella faecimaris]|uniref:Gliding motility-associated C-terminal domain-containing protein n=1 Tax=Reichenbachiella faecimaris TaxID=692418 RepID=A0A1W2G649_REIFA|nr:gliding motility-associated C-terminal domain-containing protein [Reichenbachiella faecimaris]SMD32071.1 gliding motility-associated C-terminal domain-containing protein [Reichenbachiella faecimaris]